MDMQAQIMALMCCSHGAGVVTEGIFENRFMHVQFAKVVAEVLAAKGIGPGEARGGKGGSRTGGQHRLQYRIC